MLISHGSGPFGYFVPFKFYTGPDYFTCFGEHVSHFRKGSFDGKLKEFRTTGIVKPGTDNAVWGVRVFWPLKAQYVVAYLKEDYSQVIVARDARDYVWVMARTPTVSEADYDALLAKVKALGYPMDKIRKVPQRPRGTDLGTGAR